MFGGLFDLVFTTLASDAGSPQDEGQGRVWMPLKGSEASQGPGRSSCEDA